MIRPIRLIREAKKLCFIRPIRPIFFFLGALLVALVLIGGYSYLNPNKAEASWWPEIGNNWAQRKQLTLTNNSGATLNSTAVVAVSIDTKALVDSGKIRSDCNDLRIVYHNTSSTATELTRHLVYSSGGTCASSTTTKVNFILQANITNGSSDTNYYLYYNNPSASAPSSIDDAFDISTSDALLVCPFDGSTTCAAGETPSTSTGALRYSGSKSALSFDGVNDLVTKTATSPTIISSTGVLTAEAWVYIKELPKQTTNAGIITLLNSTATVRFNIKIDNNRKVYGCATDLNTCTSASDTAINLNQWYHIAATYDSSYTLKVYINGVLGPSGTVGTGLTDDLPRYDIGRKGGEYLSGIIDEVRVSDSIRYTAAFTPSTSPFIRDSNTSLLLHMDENGSDPRNAGKAIDDSGNGNHGTITGAKYVSGLVGVDASTSDTGYYQTQSYAGHNGIFIEEGTTNKITNPSFDHSTYDTNWDAVGGNLTVTSNTTAPYYKFGSKSAKIVAAGAISGSSNMDTIGIDPDSTSTHTLSGFVYNGTSGAVGGTVDGTVAKLVFEGTAQTTTYTDMGGGWWRLSYSAATTDSTNEYGIEVADTKTIYIDGVQLEAKAYATTYTDGTLGTGYAWTSTAHNSTSTRTAVDLRYSGADNMPGTAGTISFWLNTKNHANFASSTSSDASSRWSTFFSGSGTKAFLIQRRGDNNSGNQIRVLMGASEWIGQYNISALSADTWHHFVFAWDSSNNTRNFYENGALLSASYDSGTVQSLANTTSIAVGSDLSGTYGTADSAISDLRTLNSVLTSSQVGDLYRSGLLSHSQGTVLDRFSNNKGEDPSGTWHFDEGQGATTYDSSVNKNNGTISGATWTTEDQCVSGKCLKFDGTNDKVTFPNTASLKSSSAATISLWYKPNGNPSSNAGLYYESTATSGYTRFGIFHNSNGDLMAVMRDSDSGSVMTATKVTPFTNGQWYHIEATVDASTDQLLLYLNGVQVASDTTTKGAFTSGNPADSITVGAFTGNPPAYINGFIDEVKIYPYARTAAQVEADYNARGSVQGASTVIASEAKQSLSNGLVGYWKMDEASANTCTGGVNDSCDSSGNNNNGAWYGDATSASGKFGNSVTFDGTGDYISIASNNSLGSSLNTLTISAWINKNADNDYNGIVNHDTDSSNSHYHLRYDPNGTVYALLGSYTNGYVVSVAGGGTATNWRFLTMTFDGTTLRAYIDGSLIGSDSTGTYTPGNDTTEIGRVERCGSSCWDYTNGKIDEARIYNRALSSAEVRDLYNFAPGPVGYWKMDDKVSGNSKTVVDSSGNGNNGTTSSANGTGMDCIKNPGKYGGACEFDGVDDYVDMGDTSSLESSLTNMTAEAWINVSSQKNYNAIITQYLSGQYSYYYSLNSSGVPQVFLDSSCDGIGEKNITGTGSISTGVWHHIAYVLTGGVNIKIYVDGRLDSTSTDVPSSLANCTSSVRVGGSQNNSSHSFNGLIDEVKIYNYARTAAQIQEDMAGTSALIRSSSARIPLAHYDFDEGYSTTANNRGSQGSTLNGTLTSMASPATSTSGWTNSGKFGKALNFDGSDDYVSLANESTFDFEKTDSFSSCAWINPISFPANGNTIVSKLGSSITGWEFGTFERNGDGNGLTVYLINSWSGNAIEVKVMNILSVSQWQHTCFTYDGSSSASGVKIYLNGVSRTTTTEKNTLSGTILNNNSLLIGARASTALFANMTIDEVKIYNYALTSDEILTDYNNGSALILGSQGDNSSYAKGAANQEYCIPGDSTSCAAPIARWDFEPSTASGQGYIEDTSGNNNQGTWNGTGTRRYVQGKEGWGGNFNGSDDYITRAKTTSFNISEGSIEAWVKANSFATNNKMIASFGDASANGDNIVTLEFTTASKIRIGTATSGLWSFLGTTDNTFSTNTWYHVALTVNSSGNKLYVNGTPQAITYTNGSASTATFFDDIYSTANSIDIGRLNTTNYPHYFNGQIDQVRIYNYARSAAQIAWDYNRGAPVAHWKMDECSGASIKDSSGNSNTGTLTIGASGTQTAAGTCSDGLSTSAWYNGKTGKRNYSLNFDGTDDYVDLGDKSTLQLTTQGSVSLWVKPSSVSGYHQFFTKNNPSSPYDGYILYSNGSSVVFRWDDTGTTNQITATSALSTSSWYHIVGTQTGSGLQIYINGKLVQSGGTANTLTAAKGYSAQIGSNVNYLAGQIDDVKIFNYALTGSQVKDLYNNGAVNFGPLTGSP